MAIVNGSLELGYKNLAWFNANPTLVLKEGQIVYLQQTGTYKIGNGTSTLSALSFLGVSSETQTLQNVTDLGSTTTNSITANGFVKSGGTASQFLKANGSVDSTTYLSTQVVPVGGTTGQILAKVDDTDYNLEWIENYANYTSVLKHTVKASVALTKGQAVYVSGASGTNMLVSKASNVSESTSSKTLGLIAQDLAINGQGFVITEGLLSNINTNSATIGDPVWLGVDGALIYGLASKPYAPAHLVFIGIVTRVSATVGEIFVKVQNGFELREIHDVDLITTSPSNNEILTFESSTSLWKNKSVVSALGFTPYNATNPSGYITSSALSSYVPYTGATANVNLGNNNLTIGSTGQLIEIKQTANNPTLIQTGATSSNISVRSGTRSFSMINYAADANYFQTLGAKFYISTVDAQAIGFSTTNIERLTIGAGGGITVRDNNHFTFEVTNGTKFGTATTQKLSFWNVTPIVQPANTVSLNGVLETTGLMAIGSTSCSIDKPTTITTSLTTPTINGVSGATNFNNAVQTSGAITAFTFTKPNNTGQTASTSISGFVVNGGTRQWNTGNIGTQSENVWGATTYSFVGASTITNAYGNEFFAPVAGTNCTITNNFAALFNGNVRIGSTGQLIEIKQTTNAPTYTQTGATSSVFRLNAGTRSLLFETYGTDQNYFTSYGANFRIRTGDALPIEFYTTNTKRLTILAGGSLLFAEANDIQIGTTTGTKIGTATTQKIAFWNATPIVQPTTSVTASTFVSNTSMILNDTATFDGYTIGQVVKALRNMGLLA